MWRIGFERRNQSVDIDDTATGGHNVLDETDERVAIKFFRSLIHAFIVVAFRARRQPANRRNYILAVIRQGKR